jgi:serine/threonine-protein kinase
MNAPESSSYPDSESFDHTLQRALDGAFAAAREAQAPSPGHSVLQQLEGRLGKRPSVALRDIEEAAATPMLKPLVPGDGVRRSTGKYIVHGLLGQGGVGAVHKGHDTDLGRDVALKFLHAKYAEEPALLHRFVEEAQIGGQLQHPGIVPVYELGLADGRPFFAMKLVKGQTLAQKLAERASPGSERRTFLAIFEDVCQTMAYAHARGVVHRDLKPANIMIGNFGEVQVVDWGMGKVLERGGVADEKRAAERHSALSVVSTLRSAGHGTESVPGSVMGTPAYMPPEQARGDVEAMDARSDVFALGAMLCEILTGRPPYVGSIREQLVLAARAQLDDARARLTSCSAEQDLIDLALQCLMPEPAARPQSAEKVAAAIHAHLAAAEERVQRAQIEAAAAEARAAGLKRAQKLGIVSMAVITAALVVSLWFYREASDQRARAEAAAQQEQAAAALARTQRDKAERIAGFMAETLAGAGPSKALGRDTTMLREMMDAAAKRIEGGELRTAPEAELRLRLTIGDTYRELAAYDEARRILEPAVELSRARQPDDDRNLSVALSSLGKALADRGDHAAAEELLRESVELCRRRSAGDQREMVTALGNLATVLVQRRDLEEAEALLREVVAMSRRLFPGDHPEVATGLNNLAALLLESGDAVAAEPLLREAMAMDRRLFPGDHPKVLKGLNNLALLLMDRGELAAAEPLLHEAVEMSRRLFPGDHPKVTASLGNLALVVQERDLVAAEALLREALAMNRRLFPGDHSAVATVLDALAEVLRKRGDGAAAEPLAREAAEMRRRLALLPETSAPVATRTDASGDLVARAWRALEPSSPGGERDPAAALELAKMAVANTRSADAAALQVLAAAHHASGQRDEALAAMQSALELWEAMAADARQRLGARDRAWMEARLAEYRR